MHVVVTSLLAARAGFTDNDTVPASIAVMLNGGPPRIAWWQTWSGPEGSSHSYSQQVPGSRLAPPSLFAISTACFVTRPIQTLVYIPGTPRARAGLAPRLRPKI